ncbi:hypothetical protein Nepgr_010488 [Nepenthes gracilis]|uniref:EF-hand domain-containing protein n=1 Tax=Nepenthes gracilis TaxID=150966 RepID=A0AAD3SCL0_NEPGR|nr:hypothetical protein Nepgr_010488 [Nepenthes gracilis]
MCPSGSGATSQERRSGLQQAFDVLEADHDGQISKDDLRRTFYGGASGDDDLIGTMISVADSNRDGYVQFHEFERVLNITGDGQHHPLGKGNETMMMLMGEAFRLMDEDGDGKLSYRDLKTFLNRGGFDINDEDVKAMIDLADDSAQRGGISCDALLKILAID